MLIYVTLYHKLISTIVQLLRHNVNIEGMTIYKNHGKRRRKRRRRLLKKRKNAKKT